MLATRTLHGEASNERTAWGEVITELSSWKSSGQGLSNLRLRAYSSVEMISLLSHCSGSVAGCAHAQSGWMSFG